jgi:hypothetical protein
MKKINRIGLVAVVLGMVAGPALAASGDILNLGTVEMSRGDLEQLRAMVAGEAMPAAEAPVAEPRVNVGTVEVAQSDLDRIRALMAGAESASQMAGAGEEVVNVGRVALPRSEFEALKMQVTDHLKDIQTHLARVERR